MKKQLLYLSLILLSGGSFAQQGDGGTPKSGKITINQKAIDHYTFATPDIAALRAEDVVNDDAGTAPWRFGFNNYTNLNMNNSGTWITLPNGDKIWMIELTCEGALTVNLTMDNVSIPEGNELYVYNPQKDFILGTFSEYHLYQGKLGTELVPGNTAIVEYYIPSRNSEATASLNINTVTHGYRTSTEFIEKAFNGSGSCNMNVNCADGAPWVNQRNGAVMLVSGSSGFCSGSLINNTLNDGKPYVLTANHCYSDPTTWIFRFNWQATGCTNPGTSPTFQSLSGAVLRARRTPSDFCLVEITGGLVGNTVPAAYTPYFSGWDNSGVTPATTTCIHHPSGDIKKISFDDAPAVAATAMGSETNGVWQVEWDRNTTTEGGSSGSPLFDENHRIIGQLWGGGASCSNLSAPDYYGRLSNSWNPASSNSTNQLKYWLDPTNLGAIFIDGYDPSGAPAVALDAGLNNPQGVSGTFCSATVTPQVTISNSGTDVLTSATIMYGYDGVLDQTYPWTGSLNQWQNVVVTLPTATLAGGSHTFDAEVVNPNSGTDENANNNITSSSFTTVVNGQTVSLDLNLDCWASETSWELSDASNVVLYTGSGYADSDPILVEQDFCLAYGCYNFTIMDSYGDGMSSCSTANGGNGSYNITFNGSVVAEITEPNADFGSSNTQNFCILDDSGLKEFDLSNNVSVYPNPASNDLNVVISGITVERLELLTLTGQAILTKETNESKYSLDVSGLSSGVYFLKVYAQEGTTTKQFVVKK